MRPRVNSFGKISRQKLEEHLYANQVYGFTVKRDGNLLIYCFLMMYRNNKKDPEKLYIKVSRTSKNVIGAYDENGKSFANVNEIINYTIKR